MTVYLNRKGYKGGDFYASGIYTSPWVPACLGLSIDNLPEIDFVGTAVLPVMDVRVTSGNGYDPREPANGIETPGEEAPNDYIDPLTLRFSTYDKPASVEVHGKPTDRCKELTDLLSGGRVHNALLSDMNSIRVWGDGFNLVIRLAKEGIYIQGNLEEKQYSNFLPKEDLVDSSRN